MTDVATTASVCVATAGVAAPFCAAFGFDPALLIGGTVGGFAGCLIVQTLIPDEAGITLFGVLSIMVGSVLLATLTTPLVSPWFVRTLNLSEVPAGAVRLAVGAAIGSCAQPIAIMFRARILKFVKWMSRIGGKGNENA